MACGIYGDVSGRCAIRPGKPGRKGAFFPSKSSPSFLGQGDRLWVGSQIITWEGYLLASAGFQTWKVFGSSYSGLDGQGYGRWKDRHGFGVAQD
ncbi:hypothetical protein QJS10_CPA01g00006 [Acorus calamus]|uniref:Uncharacterized protein n=1 Tax=Acorus calamus TaxID=4465 RepID=A0AAV9FHM7_ACOCL|nr:hypothetical protein QJS10_CPA01g00008 [Acorus calamus]KAK1326855.1 hypothetical protein QJS10_CPA01g00006 [Acorus calamus]